jgi:hypothetical protein
VWTPDDSTTDTCNLGQQPLIDQQVFRPKCEDYTGSVCAGNVPGKVYVPAGFTQAVLEAVGQRMQFLFAVSPRPTGCDVFMQAFVCARAFQQCDETNLVANRPVPLPRLPCRAFCEAYSARCAPLKQAVPALTAAGVFPSCTTETFREVRSCDDLTVEEPGQADYPTESTTFGSFTTDCSNWAAAGSTEMASAVTAVHSTCPAPLVKPDDPEWPTILSGACAAPCPLLIWTREEYLHMDRVADVVSAISLAASFFMALTWLIFPQNRSKRYILYLNISIFLFTFFMFITIRIRGSHETVAESLCETNTNEYHMKGYCLWQGITFAYLCGCAVFWWLIQSFDLFIKLVVGLRFVTGSKLEFRKEVAYHILAWGVPLIPVIIGLADDQMGAHAIGQPWCLFSNARNHNDTYDVSWIFWIAPMFGLCCLGAIFMGATIIKLAYASYESRKSGTKNRTPWGPYIRVILFISVMTYVWAFLFAYKLITNQKHGEWADSGTAYASCLLFTQFANPAMFGKCGSHPEERMSASLMDCLIVTTTVPGILLFLLYGTNLEIYRCWGGLFYKIFGCKCCAKYAGHTLDKNTANDMGSVLSAAGSTNGPAAGGALAASSSGHADDGVSSPRSTSLFAKSNKRMFGGGGNGSRTGTVGTARAQDAPASPTAMPTNLFNSASSVRGLASPGADAMETDSLRPQDLTSSQHTGGGQQYATRRPNLPLPPVVDEYDPYADEDDVPPPPPPLPEGDAGAFPASGSVPSFVSNSEPEAPVTPIEVQLTPVSAPAANPYSMPPALERQGSSAFSPPAMPIPAPPRPNRPGHN